MSRVIWLITYTLGYDFELIVLYPFYIRFNHLLRIHLCCSTLGFNRTQANNIPFSREQHIITYIMNFRIVIIIPVIKLEGTLNLQFKDCDNLTLSL